MGSRPKQGVARLRAKRKTRESHHMLPGVQRVWGNEPSHSQMNSHVGSWSPKWTLKSLERDCTGQNPSLRKFLYIIENLLKLRCLKWARIAHLNIWNTNYGQKKGRESNWQIWLPTTKSWESTWFPCVQPTCNILLKSSWQGLQLCFRPYCNQRFAHKVMRPQSWGSPICGNFETPTWDKKPFGCGPREEA